MAIVWWPLFVLGLGTAALGVYVLHKPILDFVSEAIECRTGVYLPKSTVGFGAALLLVGIALVFTAFFRLGFLS